MTSYRIGRLGSLVRVGLNRPIIRCQQNHVRNFSATGKTSGSGEASTLKMALIGATLGGAAGTAYSFYGSWHEKNDHMIHERKHPRIFDTVPKVNITKKIVNTKDDSELELYLFQYQTCPFCCKVRAYLDFLGLSYSVIEVDSVLRRELKWTDYKKVPSLLAKTRDGKYVQLTDSSTIISILASYMLDKKQDIGELSRLYPNVSYFGDNGTKVYDVMNKYFLMYQEQKPPKYLSKDEIQNERKWRGWADNHLVHLISPNVYRTLQEAIETFEWFSVAGEWDVHFPKWERDMMVYVGATVMWLISKRLKKRHGLDDDDVRPYLYDALDKWTNELEMKNIKFMGGNEPNLADLTVFGVLNCMEGCQAFNDCLKNTKIAGWFNSMKLIIKKNRGNVIKESMNDNIAAQPNIA